MYRVTVINDNEEYMLHDIHSQEEQIYDDELSEEMGKTATFKFTLPPQHPNLTQIIPLKSEIQIYKDKDPVFWGRVVVPGYDMYNTGTYTCVGGLSYLADSIQSPGEISGPGTVFIQKVLDVHNRQVESRKRLSMGIINVAVKDTTRTIETFSDTLTVLNTALVSVYGGYLRVRQVDGVRYLDYVNNYGETNTQTIRFGENLLDINGQMDAADIITILVPTGAGGLTIESVNNGVNYIENQEAIEKWGRIWGTVSFSEIKEPQELLEEAEKYLDQKTAFPEQLNLTALDLSVVDTDIQALKLGCWTEFVSKPHGISNSYLLQKLVRHLTAPEKDSVVFGITQSTISGETANNTHVVTEKIEQVKQSIGKDIDEKIENATKLLTGAGGGYFVIGTADDGKPQETFWMDAPTTAQARNIIRINRNGIGFSTTGINGPYRNAWTIDGNLVADFITAGTMLCDRIRGGTLEVGGTGLAKDGVITVKNASGAVVATIDKNGINMTSGSINLGNGNFVVTSGGVLTLKGTSNNTTIGCYLLSATRANIDGLVVNGSTEMRDVTAGDIYCDDINCYKIYSQSAGDSWSDKRLKHSIAEIPGSIAKKIILELKPKRFVFNESNIESIGFIAQDVMKVLKRNKIDLPIVNKHKGFFCIPYASYVALLTGTVQEQQKEINELKEALKKWRT